LSEPFDPSPYAPVSRLFWNDLYLDLAQLAEQQQCRTVLPLLAEYQQVHRVQTRSRERLIDYRPVAERHRRALLELSRQFFGSASPEREQLAGFVRENPKLERYARFRAVMARHGGYFRQWPAAWRADLSGTDDFDPAERDLHLYAQWRAHQQVTTLADAARDRDCGLYLDLPIGTHSNGYDAWYHDRSFLPNASAGAPPDPFFSKGQNWGFAPLHPERVREDGYAYVQACLQHHMRVAEVLRIDHVMGLHRIYCIPNGMAGSDGAYLSYRADELYALVALESHRHRCSVVGEDLGTVPPEVREAMTRHGLLRMYVAQFSLRETRPALELPSEHSLASLNTHDMPPFAAFVRGLDIDDRVALGALHAEQATAGKQARERLIQALRDELGCPPGDDALLLQRLLERLAQSPAPYVLASLEDLWLEAAAQNVPGTQFERPNWRRRMAHALDTLDSQADIMAALAALARPQQADAGSSLHREPSSA
jgi:4-alpha-glucanotransferase